MRACLDCGALISTGSRCALHQRVRERTRRGTPAQRYGSGYRQRHKDVINEEPWCHVAGCPYPITPANPLTADHPVPVARGGDPMQLLVVMCKRHNSGRR